MSATQTTRVQSSEEHTSSSSVKRTLLMTGIILGVGVIGTLDEVILHQLFQWHNFYIHTNEYWRIVSDGLFHLFSSAFLLSGAVMLWRQRQVFSTWGETRVLLAGIFFGMGGFNLWDGIVHHKILQVHPVREGVDNMLPYDLGFNGLAVLLLLIGWLLWRSVGYTRVRVGSARSG